MNALILKLSLDKFDGYANQKHNHKLAILPVTFISIVELCEWQLTYNVPANV